MVNEIINFIWDFCIKLRDWVKTNAILICNFIFCLIVFLLLFKTNMVDFWLVIISYFVISFIKYIHQMLKERKKPFPNVEKRFTEKLNDGTIRIKRMDLQEATLYLYQIEQYLGK